MLPCVSAPMAASTWLGSSALDVQADPEPTAKPARVERRQERLALDVEARERQRRGGAGPRGCPTTSTSGTSAATRVRTRSTSAATRGVVLRPRRDRHLERDRGRERRGHADAAREPPVLVLRPVGGAPDPGPRHEHPEPARTAPVARVRREQVPGVADVDVPEARARVHEQRDARGARGVVHGVDGLQRADLAVRVLQRGERHARTGDAPPRTPAASTRPSRSTADGRAVAGEVRGVQHGRPLDGADDDLSTRSADARGRRTGRRRAGRRCATGRGRPPGVRAPTDAAIASRAPSSSIRARRPSACSRRGSAQPWSSASRNAVRASGSSGARPPASRTHPPGSGVRHRGCRRAVGAVTVGGLLTGGHRNPVRPVTRRGTTGIGGRPRRSGPVKEARCDGADTRVVNGCRQHERIWSAR